MKELLQIYCKNNGQTLSVPPGSKLLDVYEVSGLHLPYGPTSARVNNVVEGLNYKL